MSEPIAKPAGPIIKVEELKKIYDMGGEVQVIALDGIDLTIQRNEYVAVMGPSGSGKSTLMNLIGCLDTPTSGRYFLNAREVCRLDDNELAQIMHKDIVLLFQKIKHHVSNT